MKPFRIIKNSIRDSFKSVFRNFSLSIASIICTTITLILVALAIILSVNVNHITKTLEEELTIVVYASRETTEEDIENIKTHISAIENVVDVKYKSKEELMVEMKEDSDTFKVTLEYLDNNPFLNSFMVKVKNVDDLAPITKEIRSIEGINSADYGEGTVEDLVGAFKLIKNATIGMVIALIVVTAFLIGNTIKLTIFSRKSEIEIMRLVGASNISIKLPFVFEGFLLGFIGAILPVLVTVYGYFIFYQEFGSKGTFSMIKLVEPMPFVVYTSILLIIVGAIVGMFGSGRAVRKYLKI